MDNEKSNPQELSKEARDKIKATIDWAKQREEIKNDLQTNQRYNEFTDQYEDISARVFRSMYASLKADALRWGPNILRREQQRLMKARETAAELLWQIQQKKLFNLQCLWRAEQVEIPEVKASFDFVYWSSAIKSCPFLDPITEEEVELFQRYVESDDFHPELSLLNYQYHDSIKREYKDGENFTALFRTPEWYWYYDTYMGTTQLLSLPDIRGEKEHHYIAAWRNGKSHQAKHQKAVEKMKKDVASGKIDKRPLLDYFSAIHNFVARFGDEKFKRLHEAYRYIHSEQLYDPIEIYEYQDLLEDATTYVPMPFAPDWRAGLAQAAENYRQMLIAEALPAAYDDYKMRIDIGIAFEETDRDVSSINHSKGLAEKWRQEILDGRELLGEPKDFNY